MLEIGKNHTQGLARKGRIAMRKRCSFWCQKLGEFRVSYTLPPVEFGSCQNASTQICND